MESIFFVLSSEDSQDFEKKEREILLKSSLEFSENS